MIMGLIEMTHKRYRCSICSLDGCVLLVDKEVQREPMECPYSSTKQFTNWIEEEDIFTTEKYQEDLEENVK